MSNFSFEPLKLKLATNNIIIPMQNGVADLTNAETSAKIMLAGKELFPDFDERIEGRNLITSISAIGRWIGVREVSTTNGAFIFLHPAPFRNAIYQIEVRAIDKTIVGGIFGWQWSGSYQGDTIKLSMEWQRVVSPYFDLSAAIGLRCSKIGKLELRKIQAEYGNKATDWTPAPEDVLQLATLTFYNCSAAIVGDLVKITSHTPDTTRGWVDVTVNYGNLSNTKRLNWSVEGVEPYKPLGTLLTMNNRGIKL